MACNLEEARLKKKARLSSSSGGTASTYANTVVSQSPASSMADGPNGNGANRLRQREFYQGATTPHSLGFAARRIEDIDFDFASAGYLMPRTGL
jgi:hypothetical protein